MNHQNTMASPAWINWDVQVPAEDVTNEDNGTFCIIKGNSEYEVEGPENEYIISVPDDSLQKVEWKMVQMSQITNKRPVGSSSAQDKIKCTICYKSFSCNNYLKDHMRTHTGEKPYSCDECDAAFAQKCNLRMHQRIHSGERPFMCGICGRTFNRSSHLKGHMLQHTGDKPYTCETCGQRFTNSQGKKNHMRLHLGERPFVCELCNATFTTKVSLKNHVKSHRKESRYYCTICRRKFLFRSLLFEHMTFHSASKLYTCDQCHKRFKHKHYLSKHKKTNCSSKSMLHNSTDVEEGPSNDVSKLKYLVLSTTKKAKPLYIDSDEEETYYHDSDDEKNHKKRTKPLPLNQAQESKVELLSNDSEDYLDKSYVKLLKRIGFVKDN